MFVVNKNIIHNGRAYPKNCEIKKEDPGFQDLLKAGHVNEGAIAQVTQVAKPEPLQVPVKKPVVDAVAEKSKRLKKNDANKG